MIGAIKSWLLRQVDHFGPPRQLVTVAGDSLPSKLPWRNLILANDDGEDWCVGFKCPCGCGRNIELLVIDEAHPRWDISVDGQKRPTLHPSVWLNTGCRSHFWIKNGRIQWCD
jgi:Family of unknown function (DUF6527)